MKKIIIGWLLALTLLVSGCSTLGGSGNTVAFALDVARIGAQVSMIEGRLDGVDGIMVKYQPIFTSEEMADLSRVRDNVQTILNHIKAMRDGEQVTYQKIIQLATFADENYLTASKIVGNHWESYDEYTKMTLKMIDNNVGTLREQLKAFIDNQEYATGNDGLGITLEEVLMIVSIVGPML